MFQEPEVPVVEQMIGEGLIESLEAGGLDAFLHGDGLRLVFVSGPKSARREAHDVAVALRELLREHRGALRAAVVDGEGDEALRERCRVAATPCLSFIVGGEVIEALPRVRDWADYSAVFQRYLGTPDRVTNLLEAV